MTDCVCGRCHACEIEDTRRALLGTLTALGTISVPDSPVKTKLRNMAIAEGWRVFEMYRPTIGDTST